LSDHALPGPVLADTGPIVAILSESDEHHEACVKQLERIRGPILTCWPVITEAVWLLRVYPAAITRLLSSLNGGSFELVPLNAADLSGISAILTKYRDLGIQLADASLVHLANREGVETVFTLDRRDFSVLRRAHGKKFRLIP
jgi:predicted nucleic acid-binding protein